jgi:hypothetical protein
VEIPNTFRDIAPFLQHPLVLIGFVILLFFGILTALIKAGIIPPLQKKTAGDIVKRVMTFGFIIALLVIVLGFWEHLSDRDKKAVPADSLKSSGHDSSVIIHHTTDGGDHAGPKTYCMVTLLIPSDYNDAEIRVDGRPAQIVGRKLTSVILRMVKSETSQRIVLRNTAGGECATNVLVDGDKQLQPCL